MALADGTDKWIVDHGGNPRMVTIDEVVHGGPVSSSPVNFLQGLSAGEQNDVVDRTSVYDLTYKLNQASSEAIAAGRGLELPGGTIRVDDSWWMVPEGQVFKHPVIKGAGRGGITVIDVSRNKTKPGAILQRVRDAWLSGFSIVGGNTDIATIATIDDFTYVNSLYVKSGFRDDQWSPQCGLAIDCGIGATPTGGGYADITYNQGAGAGGGSSRVYLDIDLSFHVVGLMHNPDRTVSTQGDDIYIHKPSIFFCKVPIASGQTQARCITVVGGSIGYYRTAYDGRQYGQQSGGPPTFYNTQFGVGFELISHTSSIGICSFTGGRGESFHRIGEATSATSTYPTIFEQFDFSIYGSASNPSPRCPILFEGGKIILRDCNFLDATHNIDSYFFPGDAVFENTQFHMKNRNRPFIGCAVDFNNPAILKNCRVKDETSAIVYNEDTRRLSLTSAPTIGGRISSHWSGERRRTPSAVYELTAGIGNNYVLSSGTLSNWVYGATSITFDTTNPENFCVNDILTATFNAIGKSAAPQLGPGYKITAINSSTITCDRLFPVSYYSSETGLATSIRIYVAYWAPAQALTGDTHTNTTLDNVSPITILQDGDWLIAAAGLVSGYRVRSGGGTATITLNKAATDTAAGKTLYQCRMNTVGLTPAF